MTEQLPLEPGARSHGLSDQLDQDWPEMATHAKHDNLGACHKRSVPVAETLDETTLREGIIRTLERRYAGRATHDQPACIAATAIEHYRSAAVTNFVPILAQRTAGELALRHIGPPRTRPGR